MAAWLHATDVTKCEQYVILCGQLWWHLILQYSRFLYVLHDDIMMLAHMMSHDPLLYHSNYLKPKFYIHFSPSIS